MAEYIIDTDGMDMGLFDALCEGGYLTGSLVRCRQCRHRREMDFEGSTDIQCELYGWNPPPDDHYCALGEAK